MTDHPVLIPTSFGPIEGIISEPDEAPQAALVITQAGGRAGRWGTNAVWTRAARELAQRGIVVLRTDYVLGSKLGTPLVADPAEESVAEWERELLLREEIGEWFTDRTGGTELLLAGFCRGASVAVLLAARNRAISRLLLMAPPFVETEPRRRRFARGLKGRTRTQDVRITPALAGDLTQVIKRIPVTMICSDHEAVLLRGLLDGQAVDLDLIPGPRLNRLETPELQAAALEQIVRWGSCTNRSMSNPGTRSSDAAVVR